MAPNRAGPVLAKKRLAFALRNLREAAGFTLDHVAGELLISVSKLSRLEKSQGLPQLRDVRDLINFYGIANTPQAEDLMRWTRDGRRKGWWEVYHDVIDSEHDEYIAYETEATVNLAYTIPFVHGLLQSEQYIHALISTFKLADGPDATEQLVKTRHIRQENLVQRPGLPPLELRVVLHEVCLRQRVGTPEVMASQLNYLLAMSERDNIELYVLEATAEPHRAASGMWQHFSFGEDIDRDVVFLESPSGFTYIEEERKTRLYHRWFEDLCRRSLSPKKTRDHIRTVLAVS